MKPALAVQVEWTGGRRLEAQSSREAVSVKEVSSREVGECTAPEATQRTCFQEDEQMC